MRGRLQLTRNARFIDRLSHLEPKLEPRGGLDMGHRKPFRTGFPNVRLGRVIKFSVNVFGTLKNIISGCNCCMVLVTSLTTWW